MQKYLPVSGKIGFVPPILVGYFTVLSLFSTQAFRLDWSTLQMPLIIVSIVGTSVWLIFYLLPLTRNASSVIASVATLTLMLWMVFPYPIMPVMITLSTIIVLYDLPKQTNRGIAVILFCVLIASIITSLGYAVYQKIDYATSNIHGPQPAVQLARTPDIYFIVPDRFASPKGLAESGLDSEEFVTALESRGFYVPYGNVSRYIVQPSDLRMGATTRTLRFMASVLNRGMDIELSVPYNRASNLVKQHTVGRILKDNGYIYHHIGDWWQETLSNPQADFNYIYRGYSVLDYLSSNELATAVVDRSWLRDINVGSLLPTDLLFSINRERNMYQLETFCRIAAEDSEQPKFVFVHILLPHPPYTWPVDDGIPYPPLSTMQQYLGQTKFTMSYLLDMIDAIADRENSIIIIQSDEGVAFATLQENNRLSNDQWNGVLSAWHIPNEKDKDLRDVPVTEILDYVIDNLQQQAQEKNEREK